MRLWNHQRDATWDIWPVLASRHLASVYMGRLDGWYFLFSGMDGHCHLNERCFSLEEENIPVFGGCTDDTHGGIYSQKTVWSSSHNLATEPHITRAAAAGTSPCYPCGWSHQDGVAGQRLWGRPGLPPELPPYQQCDLGKSNHWISWSLHLFGNHKAMHQGFLVKICESTGSVCDARCVAGTHCRVSFSFPAKEPWGHLSDGVAVPGRRPDCFKAVWQPHCLSLCLTGLGAWTPVLANGMLGAAFWGPQERLSTLKGQRDEEKCPLWCRQSFHVAAADRPGQNWEAQPRLRVWALEGSWCPSLWTAMPAFCSLWISSESLCWSCSESDVLLLQPKVSNSRSRLILVQINQ